MGKLYSYMFISMEKDNEDVENFHDRCKLVLEYEENEDNVHDSYLKFVSNGVVGEKTRLYRSVNARDEERMRDELMIKLLRDNPSMANMESVMMSVAKSDFCRAEYKWLINIDSNDESIIGGICVNLSEMGVPHEVTKTPNGYAIVCEHGFNPIDFKEKWKGVDFTINKDAFLFKEIQENLK